MLEFELPARAKLPARVLGIGSRTLKLQTLSDSAVVPGPTYKDSGSNVPRLSQVPLIRTRA